MRTQTCLVLAPENHQADTSSWLVCLSESVAQLHGFPYQLSPFPANVIASVNGEGCGLDEPWDESRPILVVGLEKEEDALALAHRGVGVR